MGSSKHLLILITISSIMLLSNLQVIPVNIMEARNFITAREMVEDGNWILTTMNGEPRYEKPPLPTWITAVLGGAFNFESLFAMRIGVCLITILLIVFIYKLSLRLGLSKDNSLYNGLIATTSFYIYFAGRDNQWDMYCHSFMIVSIFYLWKIFQKKGKTMVNVAIGGAFLAFSILSKGPISLYGLLLPFLIAYGWIYKFQIKQNKTIIWALLLYILIGVGLGVSWTAYIHWVDPDPLQKMAKVETSRWVNDYNSKPIYYYWNFFTQSGIWTFASLLSLLYPYMKSRVSNIRAYKFTLIWTLGSLLLLSIIPEKKVRYILPTLIPLALNTGFYIEYMIKGILNKTDKLIIKISFGIIAFIGILYPFLLFLSPIKEKISHQIEWAIFSSCILFSIGMLLLFQLINLKNYKLIFYLTISLQCAVMVSVFPLSKSFTYNPEYKSAKSLNKILGRVKLYDYNGMTPELVWDYGKKIPTIDHPEIEVLLNKYSQIGLLCPKLETDKLIEELNKKYKAKKISYVDVNITSPKNKDYKDRLTRNLIIIYK